MGECTARDLGTVRQGLLSDVTRTAERAKLDRHALHIRNWVIDERFAHDHTHHTSYQVGMRIKIRILRFVWYDIGLEFHEDGYTRAHGDGAGGYRRLVERAHSAHLKVLRRQPRRQFAGWKDSHPSARYIRPKASGGWFCLRCRT